MAGIAVHIAARVMAIAAPNEVLVSRTVKDLVAGSGLEFHGRGSHRLKGVPDEWDVFGPTDSDDLLRSARLHAPPDYRSPLCKELRRQKRPEH